MTKYLEVLCSIPPTVRESYDEGSLSRPNNYSNLEDIGIYKTNLQWMENDDHLRCRIKKGGCLKMTKAAQEYLQSKSIIIPDEKRRYKVVGDVYILKKRLFSYRLLKRKVHLNRVERRKLLGIDVNYDNRYYNF